MSDDAGGSPRLKILTLTNLYPPHHLGGYEMACADVVDALRERGHDMHVVTSSYGVSSPQSHDGMERVLHYTPYHSNHRSRFAAVTEAVRNRARLQAAVQRIAPDVIHVFNVAGLGGAIVDWLHRQHIPVVHDVSDTWLPNTYDADVWYASWRSSGSAAKKLLRRAALTPFRTRLDSEAKPIDLSRSYYRSAFLRDSIKPSRDVIAGTTVIHHGVKLSEFVPTVAPSERTGVLYAGRLSREKGVSVLLEGIAGLANRVDVKDLRVTLAGSAGDPVYLEELRAIASRLPCRVAFAGKLRRDEVRSLLDTHAVFVLPVLWDEPFSIGLLEAMAMGSSIVATRTGGSREILVGDENCLVVRTGNADDITVALARLLEDESLRARLSLSARQTAEHFDFAASIDRIESHLRSVAAGSVVG